MVHLCVRLLRKTVYSPFTEGFTFPNSGFTNYVRPSTEERSAAIVSHSMSDLANLYPGVKFKIGNEKLVKVDDSASRKLTSLLMRQGRPQGALRIAVIGGGCSGLQYKMDLVDGPRDRDIVVESGDVRVVIDPKSALFVSGSELRYSDDLQHGGFKVTNPNAVAHCSCGESFAA
jgi:iron-sulfur cluster assembly accessory protein